MYNIIPAEADVFFLDYRPNPIQNSPVKSKARETWRRKTKGPTPTERQPVTPEKDDSILVGNWDVYSLFPYIGLFGRSGR